MFNGDNYAEEWVAEAKKRGLLNLKSTPEALSYYDKSKNVKLFKRLNIYTAEEVRARKDILLENYCKVINIEAVTMCEITLKMILPAAMKYTNELAENIVNLKALGLDAPVQNEALTAVSELLSAAHAAEKKLAVSIEAVKANTDLQAAANAYYNQVVAAMQELRAHCDKLETIMPKELWPFPSYSDILLY